MFVDLVIWSGLPYLEPLVLLLQMCQEREPSRIQCNLQQFDFFLKLWIPSKRSPAMMSSPNSWAVVSICFQSVWHVAVETFMRIVLEKLQLKNKRLIVSSSSQQSKHKRGAWSPHCLSILKVIRKLHLNLHRRKENLVVFLFQIPPASGFKPPMRYRLWMKFVICIAITTS